MNQSSKSELDKILKVFGGQSQEGLGNITQAKAKLLDLALSCLPDKQACGDWNYSGKFEDAEKSGANSAIDTIEANMRAKFNG